MDSQFMDAGTYAWIVIIIFFVIFSSLQIRNCIRNVRNNSSNFSEMYPDGAGASCGQSSSVYTIDVHNTTPVNFTNPGYVPTEGKGVTNDGLPSYEEAIGGVKTPIVPTAPPMQPHTTIDVVNEDNSSGQSSRGRRHRNRRHHRSHHHSDAQNENSEPSGTPEDSLRHHRRGSRLRKHLAKMNRRKRSEAE